MPFVWLAHICRTARSAGGSSVSVQVPRYVRIGSRTLHTLVAVPHHVPGLCHHTSHTSHTHTHTSHIHIHTAHTLHARVPNIPYRDEIREQFYNRMEVQYLPVYYPSD